MLRKTGAAAIVAGVFIAAGSLLPPLNGSHGTAQAAPTASRESIQTLSVKVRKLQADLAALRLSVKQLNSGVSGAYDSPRALTSKLRAIDYRLATVCSRRTVVTSIAQSSNGQVTARMIAC